MKTDIIRCSDQYLLTSVLLLISATWETSTCDAFSPSWKIQAGSSAFSRQCCSSSCRAKVEERLHQSLSTRSSTQLGVSIGLGPGDEKDKKELPPSPSGDAVSSGTTATLVESKGFADYFYDQNDTSNDTPQDRFARMSKIDHTCDEWFTSLLGDINKENAKTALPSSITSIAHEALFHRVIPTESEDVPRRIDDEEWTPFIKRRRLGVPYAPPYGLENFGIPILRRGAEAWRQFDVPGLVETDYSGRASGLGTDLILDDDTAATYENALSIDSCWLSDEGCFARLVYIDGRFCPTLSKQLNSRDVEAQIPIVCNINANDSSAQQVLSKPELIKRLQRLPDGFTDEILDDDDDDNYNDNDSSPPRLFSKLSGPDHNVGSARSQFAINGQQGTASFAALNTLKAESVALIDIPLGVKVSKPILIMFAYTGRSSGESTEDNVAKDDSASQSSRGVAFHPRVIVSAGKQSCASVVHSVVDLNINGKSVQKDGHKNTPLLHNGYTQLFIGTAANITHSYIDESGGIVTPNVEDDFDEAKQGDDDPRQKESERPGLSNTILECIDAQVTGRNGSYVGTLIGMGGAGLVRIGLCTSLLRPTSHAEVNGLLLSGGAQRGDMRTTIHHMEQGCTSRQEQKNMVGGRATSTFKGRIRVEQDAQQTDSNQISRTLLLTDKCRIWTMPSLEIVADDVKCTHGATVSDLSEEELFYLRSRGINRKLSRNLLMYAFVEEVGSTVDESVFGNEKSGLRKRLAERLENLVPKGDRVVFGDFQRV